MHCLNTKGNSENDRFRNKISAKTNSLCISDFPPKSDIENRVNFRKSQNQMMLVITMVWERLYGTFGTFVGMNPRLERPGNGTCLVRPPRDTRQAYTHVPDRKQPVEP